MTEVSQLAPYQIPPVVMGAVFIVAGIPLILRLVPPNHVYGFRLSKKVFRPEVWYPVNALGGWMLAALGTVLLGLGLVLPLIPIESELLKTNLVAGVAFIGVVVMAIVSYAYLGRLHD